MAILLSTTELERLERIAQAAQRLAFALGQDAELLQRVESREIHPAMAAFGLWRDEDELAGLADEIVANRQRQRPRDGIAL